MGEAFGTISGIVLGAVLGSRMGICGKFGAIRATIPTALAGGAIGYIAGAITQKSIQKIAQKRARLKK